MNQDVEILRQTLDQIRYVHPPSETSRTNSHPPSGTSRQLRPLRALTEQLKRTNAASPSLSSTEEADRATKVLEELQTLSMKIDFNLQLLEHFISFLRTSRQVRVPDSGKCFLFFEIVSEKLFRVPQAEHCWIVVKAAGTRFNH